MEFECFILMRELKMFVDHKQYQKVVQKVQNYLCKDKISIEISNESICSIMMAQQEAVNILLNKNFYTRHPYHPSITNKLYKISWRNIRDCYEIFVNTMSKKIGILHGLDSPKKRKIGRQCSVNKLPLKDLKKNLQKYYCILLNFLLIFCLQVKSQQSTNFLTQVIRKILPIFKDQTFLSTLFYSSTKKIIQYHLFTFIYSNLPNNQLLLQFEQQFNLMLCGIASQMRILELKRKDPLKDCQQILIKKLKNKYEKLLLVALLAGIKKDLKISKFYPAMEGIRFFGEVIESFFQLPQNFRSLLDGYTSVLYTLSTIYQITQQKLIQYLVKTTSSIQKLIRENKKEGFNAYEYFNKKIEKYYSPASLQKKQENKNIFKLKKKFEKSKENKLSISFGMGNIVNIKRRVSQFRKSFSTNYLQLSFIKSNFMEKKESKQEKKMNKRNLIRTGTWKKKILVSNLKNKQNYSYDKNVIQYSKDYLLKKKKQQKYYKSLTNSIIDKDQQFIQMKQPQRYKTNFLPFRKSNHSRQDSESDRNRRSQINIDQKQIKNKIDFFIELLKENRGKLKLKKYFQKMLCVETRNINRAKKERNIREDINLKLEKIASCTLLLSRRKKRQKSFLDTSQRQEYIDESLLRERCYQRSKMSIKYNLEKLAIRGKNLKHKREASDFLPRKTHHGKLQSSFTPLF